MIPRTDPRWQHALDQTAHKSWKQELAQLITDPEQLCQQLSLSIDDSAALKRACQGFPLRVPRAFLSRIKKGDPNDPLLLQVLPQAQELQSIKGFSHDPLEEASFTPVEGLLHKYHGRVLIVLNGHCAIHCRYCFRRHFPYQEHRLTSQHWHNIINYISKDKSISEVILSGGDPLSCTDDSLGKRIRDLESITHLQRLRIHTRLPIMIPQRITTELLTLLEQQRLHTTLVIHSNHAQEIDAQVESALLKLHQHGIVLLNQSVLLKNINDNLTAQQELSQRLFTCKVLPYYLHMLDSVQGAAHFAVSTTHAYALHKKLQETLPGYLVPKLVIEQAQQKHKTNLIDIHTIE